MKHDSTTGITGTRNLFNAVVSLIVLVASFGWGWNIVKIAGGSFDPLTGMMVLRCIGIIVPPLGIILGFMPA